MDECSLAAEKVSRLAVKEQYVSLSSRYHRGLRKGVCKWFNVIKGWGFITPEDGGPDVFVHQNVVRMPGFRSLHQGEPVEYEAEETSRGVDATVVTGPGGLVPRGSDIRPLGKRGIRRIRCYNCGYYGTHSASKCKLGPLPKCCYKCRSHDHLLEQCPFARRITVAEWEAQVALANFCYDNNKPSANQNTSLNLLNSASAFSSLDEINHVTRSGESSGIESCCSSVDSYSS